MNTREESAMKTAIDLILISVRTAPKSGGIDDVVSYVVSDKEKKAIVKAMVAVGEQSKRAEKNNDIGDAKRISWVSDAQTVEKSQGLVLIGVRGQKVFNFNCTMCGFQSCAAFCKRVAENQKTNPSILGPFCVLKLWDIGIAIASAAKTASMLNVDNRIMYRIGVAALKTPLLKKRFIKGDFSSHIKPILGLPLSASGKNIYFDRLDKLQAANTLSAFFAQRTK